jgi:Bacterial type II/III secretion system short domain
MTRRPLPVFVGLLLGLLAGTPAWAEGPSGSQKKKEKAPDTAGLERRVADLEAQVAKLVKEVQGLRGELKAPAARPEGNAEIQVFTLKNAKATEMAKTLQDLLQEKDGPAPRIVGDPSSNSVLIRASREQIEVIAAVITRLEEATQANGAKQGNGR